MPTYVKERSFAATLRSVHPDYSAPLDFSKLVQESEVVPAGVAISEKITSTCTEEYDYLTATTLPREALKFWFLYRKWDNGTESYEIKVRHEMFFEKKAWLGNLVIEDIRLLFGPFANERYVKLYVRPTTSVSNSAGWKVLKGGALLAGADLHSGNTGPVQIIAPNGNPLGIYKQEKFGQQWWAYISCAKADEPLLTLKTVPVQIMMDIHEYAMDDPMN